MNIAEWSIKNNRTVTVVLILLFVAGLLSFKTISKLEDPEFTIRTAVVTTVFPGAMPDKVEELVTDKLEEKIRELDEIDYIESESLPGMSIIKVNILDKYSADVIPQIWQKLRNKVADAQPFLPEGVAPSVVNDEFGDVFGLVFAITSDGFNYRDLKEVAEYVRDEVKRIPSVGKVWIYGLQEERVYVEFSNARLAELGVNPYQISEVLARQNAIRSSGDLRIGPDRVVFESTGEFKSVEDLENTVLRLPGGAGAVYLRDIAEIKRGFIDPSQPMTRIDGLQAVTLAVSMRSGFNIIEMGKEVKDKVNEIQQKLPIGLDFQWLVFSPTYVQRSIDDFSSNLLQAILFVLVVVLIFAGMRMGLIVGTLVPMAMLTCLAFMPLFGVSLHSISIAALIIALGMLVDNGVVVTENILVRLNEGESKLKACSQAVGELYLALLAATLTTI
ncbi:MAG: efflux RND transporter permease subunit, partial [bacterium]|nr:efflux RND transporter permease subunit [bacterium]